MKTTNYKKGDVVILSDGKHYIYLGIKRIMGEDNYCYEPLEASNFNLMSDSGGRFAPFSWKVAVEIPGPPRKWYQKIGDWWKASNRWKHFLFAIPLGAVCGAPFTTGVGLGMEVKDHLYGNKADFVDFHLTAFGGVIGHGVMLLVGLDYMIGYLINLI
ncbi:hypothetical protein BK687P1_00021 [Bacteroides phage BK687P1]|nr:hypothetical protein BK687P1_00021 [Bacteroides phage BK687P1]